MSEIRELLPEYLLGSLGEDERLRVERALASSPELRAELDELHNTLFTLAETLDPVPPPEAAWEKIRSRLGQGKVSTLWPSLAAVAATLALAFAGLSALQYQTVRSLRAEEAKIASWLANPEAEWRILKDAQGRAFGTLFWTKGGGYLIVLSEPAPANKVYQAWGRKNGEPVSLGVFRGRVFETRYQGFERVGVSLEPMGGSQKPTKPLGSVPVS